MVLNVILTNKMCWLLCKNSHLLGGVKQEEAEDKLLPQNDEAGFICVSVGGRNTLLKVVIVPVCASCSGDMFNPLSIG